MLIKAPLSLSLPLSLCLLAWWNIGLALTWSALQQLSVCIRGLTGHVSDSWAICLCTRIVDKPEASYEAVWAWEMAFSALDICALLLEVVEDLLLWCYVNYLQNAESFTVIIETYIHSRVMRGHWSHLIGFVQDLIYVILSHQSADLCLKLLEASIPDLSNSESIDQVENKISHSSHTSERHVVRMCVVQQATAVIWTCNTDPLCSVIWKYLLHSITDGSSPTTGSPQTSSHNIYVTMILVQYHERCSGHGRRRRTEIPYGTRYKKLSVSIAHSNVTIWLFFNCTFFLACLLLLFFLDCGSATERRLYICLLPMHTTWLRSLIDFPVG